MNNTILIGMPGVGKSTIGKLLAKKIKNNYIDTDDAIVGRIKMPLSAYIQLNGTQKFKELETSTILSLDVKDCIISTGGSVVYMDGVMHYLKKIGCIIYLENNFETIEKRILNAPDRGLVITPNQTLKDLYEERIILYQKYADFVVNCENLSATQNVNKILCLVKNN